MLKDKTYKFLFLLFMVLFSLPLALKICHIPAIRPIEGYIPPVEKTELSANNVFNGTFQNYLDELAAADFGGRSFYVRCYNQLMYSCFHVVTNNNIVIGKGGEMFLKQYTDDVSGVTLREKFVTVDSARNVALRNITRTKELIDTLKAHNIPVLIVLAPSKTSVYPEFLPDSIKPADFSLQREYARLFDKYQIPCLDFQPVFSKLKEKAGYPLYTKYGTHWSHGTIPMVADTLLRCISSAIQKPMPHITLIDSNITRKYKPSDKELEATCNLMFPLRHPPMPMPVYALSDIPANYQKPNLLIVADSYFTQLENSPFTEAFENVDYWKYNETSFSKRTDRSGPVEYLDHYTIIKEADVVVIMFTTMFAYDYLFGFAETALKAFERGEGYSAGDNYEGKINFIIQRIKSDPKWLRQVEKQAKEKHISVEENLRLNAEYVYEMENKGR